MVGRNYKKKTRSYSEEDIQNALNSIEQGSTCRAAARSHGLPAHVLRFRLDKKLRGEPFIGQGKKPLLNKEEEIRLAKYINTLCRFGFYPSCMADLRDLTCDFITRKGLNDSFKTGIPGKYWMEAFAVRHNISFRKMRMMNMAHVNPACLRHPVVVDNYYNSLEEITGENNLSPNQIWTCFEVGFPAYLSCHDLSFDVGMPESISCLAVCNAAGQALAPLMIHAGKGVPLDWMDTKSYASSDSGCLTAALFKDWFNMFLNTVTQRPLFVIIDSPVSHLPLELVEKAGVERIHFIKQPCCTKKPLDFCFGQFQIKWRGLLEKWFKTNNLQMSKVDFAKQLSAVWYKCLSKRLIVEGYEYSGIYPIDRSKFSQPGPVDQYSKLNASLLSAINKGSVLGDESQLTPPDSDDFIALVTTSSPTVSEPSGSQEKEFEYDEPAMSAECEEDETGTDYSDLASCPDPDCDVSIDHSVAEIAVDRTGSTVPSILKSVPVNDHYETCWCTRPPPPVAGKKWIPTWTLIDDKSSGSMPKVSITQNQIKDIRIVLTRIDDDDLIPVAKRRHLASDKFSNGEG